MPDGYGIGYDLELGYTVYRLCDSHVVFSSDRQSDCEAEVQRRVGLRCEITDHLVGTDTEMVGQPCQCRSCQS